MEYQYDLIVIGGGPGGYLPALRAAELGLRTALIEKDAVGGTCLNRGCIPTKTLLHSAELYRRMQESAVFGVTAEQVSFSMEAIMDRKEQVKADLGKGIEGMLKKAKVTLIRGTGVLTAPHEVVVDGGEHYTSDKILLAAGSAPARIPIPGMELPGVENSDGMLERREVPYQRLVIIGGGVIGVEFASIYQALGTQVIILEALDRILANLDKEFSQSVKMLMKKRGGEIHTSAAVSKIEKEGGLFRVTYLEKEQEQTVEADGVLVAVGRKPCTEGLLGAEANVATERGRILVNDHFQTSQPNVYAAGDVIGGIQLAHVATAEGMHAVAHMTGTEAGVRLDLVPSCVYTDPEIASVGLTADEAKQKNIAVKTAKYPMSANGKSYLSNQERGFVKLVYGVEDRKVLGAQMLCARATDMITTFGTAIANGLTVEEMKKVMYPHPTFSEGIGEVLELAK